jgi:hypothetical protein
MTSNEASIKSSNLDSKIPMLLNRITVSTQATLNTRLKACIWTLMLSVVVGLGQNQENQSMQESEVGGRKGAYNGYVIDAFVLENQIISEPGVIGF